MKLIKHENSPSITCLSERWAIFILVFFLYKYIKGQKAINW